MTRTLIAALLLVGAPAVAQDYDCPPDVPADDPRCVPTAGLASQAYNIGDRLDEDVPLDPADREDVPPLMPGEAFAEVENLLMRVMIDGRIIMDVIDTEAR
ncbi:hypothetical protein JSE7799_02772 [Jannaschia seosinensis]|uniref:Uncharacterized protein n=1 Tax=Jannaschia seosinensis TaxID=313367 RepID=A0A0M7BDT1_9RHOB|nr:hypothetical protein [Jannaschia seosinensis]CUH40043.1 hypothetical protein JSE7799_02772 [Jannaschia seosinensis]